MPRIGNQPITLPAGVTISVSPSNRVEVVGSRGTLCQSVNPVIKINVKDQVCLVKRASDQKSDKALQGLYRSLINNMVKGISEGFTKRLEIIGIGYKAKLLKEGVLELHLGYSHSIVFILPKEVMVTNVVSGAKNPIIDLESNDKQLLGQVASKIRSLRKPEPYKGKGVRISGEYVRRKEGKTAGK